MYYICNADIHSYSLTIFSSGSLVFFPLITWCLRNIFFILFYVILFYLHLFKNIFIDFILAIVVGYLPVSK